MTTLEFIEKANKKFIFLSDILVSSYKIAYRDTCELECRLILANMYLNILKSLGENYALSNDEINILDLLVKSTIAPSKSEARRLVQGNGISINNEKETNESKVFKKEEIKDLIIGKGKKTHIKVNLTK